MSYVESRPVVLYVHLVNLWRWAEFALGWLRFPRPWDARLENVNSDLRWEDLARKGSQS